MEKNRPRIYLYNPVQVVVWALTLLVGIALATSDVRSGGASAPAVQEIEQPARVQASGGLIAFVKSGEFEGVEGGREAIFTMNAQGGNVQQLTQSRTHWPSISPNGRFIAYLNDFTDINVMNVNGSGVRTVISNVVSTSAPAWSPDSTMLAYDSEEGHIGNRDIYVVNVNGGPPQRLTTATGSDSAPSWSANNKIAFISERSGATDVFVMEANGNNPLNRTNSSGIHEGSPNWSPNSGKIVFRRGSGLDAEIYVMNADGSSPQNLTNNAEQEDTPDWSPDGTEIVYVHNNAGDMQIYVMNANGSNKHRIGIQDEHDDLTPSWGTGGGPTVLVQDEDGQPVPGAMVYRECILLGTTNISGTVTLTTTPALNDQLIARKQVYEGATSKGSHDGWAYHVWLTNINQQEEGTESAYVITDPTLLTHTLTISTTSAQIGFNVVASVEYNATDDNLSAIAAGLGGQRTAGGGYYVGASDFLMDVTDGQMYFEKVTIYEDKQRWDDADYQFLAYQPRANANVRSVLLDPLTSSIGHIYAHGPNSYGTPWNQSSAFTTFIHEFGHYAIGARDEYYYLSDGDTSTCNLNPHPSYGRRASIMANHRDSSEFCTQDNHNPQTHQGLIHGESVWQTLVDNWDDNQGRWDIQSPADRGISVLRGPGIPLCTDVEGAIPQIVTVPASSCAPILVTVTLDGAPVAGASLSLDHNNASINQGVTDARGQARIYGAVLNSDTVRARGSGVPGFLYTGSEGVTSCNAITIPLSIFLADPDRPDGQWPLYWLTATPDYTQNEVHVVLHFTAEPPSQPTLYASQGGISRQQITLVYDPVGHNYTGDYAFDPNRSRDFQFEVGLSGAQGEELFPYRFNATQFHTSGPTDSPTVPTNWDLFPPETMTNLSVDANSMPDGTGVMGGHVNLPAATPSGLLAVGGPYTVQGQNPITGSVQLSLEYQSEYFCGLVPGSTSVYRYNGTGWDVLPTSLNEEWHLAAADITDWGIYAVFAQPNPQTTFSDVPAGSTFHQYISWMTCRGIASGYADNTFRPNNNATRGQISKMISLAYQWYLEPPGGGLADAAQDQGGILLRGKGTDGQAYTFTDVPPGSTFYLYIEATYREGVVGGYPCGGAGEPCDPQNRPYFRPNNNVTRGQIAKIISNGSKFNEPVSGQTFEDVAPGSTFYDFIERMAARSIITGYPCGSQGEPCGPGNRPYFRPGANATRGQLSKMIYLAAQPR